MNDVEGLISISKKYGIVIEEIFGRASEIVMNMSLQDLEIVRDVLHFDDNIPLDKLREELVNRLLRYCNEEKQREAMGQLSAHLPIIPCNKIWEIKLRNFIGWKGVCHDAEILRKYLRGCMWKEKSSLTNEAKISLLYKNKKELRELLLLTHLAKTSDEYQTRSHTRQLYISEILPEQNISCICGSEASDPDEKRTDWVKACSNNYLHKHCFDTATKTSGKCPYCNIMVRSNGISPTGKMYVKTISSSCAGYAGTTNTICITYSMNGANILWDGKPISISAESRVAYIPNTEEGREVTELLKVAFKFGKMFIYGHSLVRGMVAITFGTIHIKTSMMRGAWGWPDPTYFDRVKGELLAKYIDVPLIENELWWNSSPNVVIDNRAFNFHKI